MEIILQLRMLTVVIDGLDIIFRIADFLLLRITLQHRWSNQCAESTLIIYRIDLIKTCFFHGVLRFKFVDIFVVSMVTQLHSLHIYTRNGQYYLVMHYAMACKLILIGRVPAHR